MYGDFSRRQASAKVAQKNKSTAYTMGNDTARVAKAPLSVTTTMPYDASTAGIDINPTPIFDLSRGE